MLCPRNCGVDRAFTTGFCGTGREAVLAFAGLHPWEEPPISGSRGSGAIFFGGCNMRCVYCQNHQISRHAAGRTVMPAQLAALFLELAGQGAHNINLVSAMHVVPQVAEAIALARADGLSLPVIYNTNAYEKPETLRLLDGLIDIYLPDLKYNDDIYAIRYSGAPSYFETAITAILEMWRQVGGAVFDADGLARRGLIIRHLVLPGLRHDSMRILDWIAAHLPDAHVSLMAQYFPAGDAAHIPALHRRITTFEYDSVVNHFRALGLKNGFTQRRDAATEDYVPAF